MTFPQIFKLYIWLADTFRRSNGITLEDLNQQWVRTAMSDGKELSRSTFLRHKEDLSDIFGINITCIRDNGYRYLLEDRGIFNKDSVQNWMISTLSVSNVLSEGVSLNDRIVLESIPASTWLPVIIKAMKGNDVLHVEYKKYSSSQSMTYTIEPYSLKVHKRRWYLLGLKQPDKEFRTFSLDRIVNIGTTGDHFELAHNFSTGEFYRDCYGIVHGTDTVAEHIVLRAYDFEAKQMRDLPIHHSQKVIDDSNERYTDYELYLRPTNDFISHILERGRWLKVLEPSWLADKVAEEHRLAAAAYEHSDDDKKDK